MNHLDQMHNAVMIKNVPKRIISLVPSLSELLVDLGLGNQLVGVTRFCVHPKTLRKSKQVIGGTKDFDFEKIRKLKPDLIIGNKEENYLEGIETLRSEFPVWMSDVYNLQDAIEMIQGIGAIVDREEAAKLMCEEINHGFENVSKRFVRPTLYMIWYKPMMAAGVKTFINDVMLRAGFQNVLSEEARYPELSRDDIIRMNPSLVLLSSEPYPFKEKHLTEIEEYLPDTKVLLVDGEMFSWYGSRLTQVPRYLNELINSIEDN